jgi:copper(I)-binding protein
MMSKSKFLALMCIALATYTAQSQVSTLRVTDAWIRAAPPGAMVLAGYMTVENSGPEDVKITAAESPQFGMIELHRTVIEDDIARMRRQPYFLVPAGGKLVLTPNDRHLMMMMPNAPLRLGDDVTVVLTFDNGASLKVNVPLRSIQ